MGHKPRNVRAVLFAADANARDVRNSARVIKKNETANLEVDQLIRRKIESLLGSVLQLYCASICGLRQGG
jgi:hypothetical protein